MYSASVLDIERCPGLGLRIASADDDAVVECLDPSCHKLRGVSAFCYILTGHVNGYMRERVILGLTFGRKVQPM